MVNSSAPVPEMAAVPRYASAACGTPLLLATSAPTVETSVALIAPTAPNLNASAQFFFASAQNSALAVGGPVQAARAAAVVCHPHPLHGGTMHNHVTYRLAQAWRDAGVACVRFNFRGVGRSTGAHDEGRGEVDDAAAALDWLAQQTPGVPLYASGFSFGSRAALALGL